jgi:hypothetical protein
MMQWTDEAIGRVRDLREQGHTAAHIARVVGASSRNAVLGIIHRAKLRSDPAEQDRINEQRRARETARRELDRAKREADRERQRQLDAERKAREELLAFMDAHKGMALREAAEQATAGAERCDMLSLRPGVCRFPMWADSLRPGVEDMVFCGARAERGAYCPAHGALAYAAYTPGVKVKAA